VRKTTKNVSQDSRCLEGDSKLNLQEKCLDNYRNINLLGFTSCFSATREVIFVGLRKGKLIIYWVQT
jgi:hypothetical protein